MIKITNVYDNLTHNKNFKSDWGFSCLIEHPNEKILFDTGAHPEILEENLKKVQIDPGLIDKVIISHKHWDHSGAVIWLAKQNPNLKIYLPRTWSRKLESQLLDCVEQVITVEKDMKISEDLQIIFSKNIFINELVLGIKTSQGIVLITGCSHTGIDKIVAKSVNYGNILAVLGGFHLFRSSTNRIKKIISYMQKLDIKFIAPCHCTGENAIKILSERLPQQFYNNGVGAEYLFEL
jgi:7,8-dihydropterin-6-yl-methyl-4-(beta-D-ribofuranosyl)aminobenzene 5'-phosphate synthase